MTKRMVSAHVDTSDTKADLLNAIARGKPFDIMVRDPLVLGIGYFNIQEAADDIILKITDAENRDWMLFVERTNGKVTAREDDE